MALQFQDIQAPATGIDSTIPTVTVLGVDDSQLPEAPIETARSIQKTHIHGNRAHVRITVMRREEDLAP
jgi:hypothetical protein